jgi:thioredoxin reductase (NADPH)
MEYTGFLSRIGVQKLTEDMVHRVRAYGREESSPAKVLLFTHGEPKVDSTGPLVQIR